MNCSAAGALPSYLSECHASCDGDRRGGKNGPRAQAPALLPSGNLVNRLPVIAIRMETCILALPFARI
jgi:hypothetical protein